MVDVTSNLAYIGNDHDEDSDKEPEPPVKVADKPVARTTKRNAPEIAPSEPRGGAGGAGGERGGRGGRRGGFTGSEDGMFKSPKQWFLPAIIIPQVTVFG